MLEQNNNRINARKTVRPAAGPQHMDMALTPKEFLMMLRQHLLMIILLTVAGLLVGGSSWLILSKVYPRYTAETYIKVLPFAEKNPTVITPYTMNKDVQLVYRQSLASIILQQSMFNSLLNRDKVQATEWFKHFGGGSVGRSIELALSDLKSSFRAVPERDTDFIRVSMTCKDKDEAALIVNEMVDVFVKSQGVTEGSDVSQSRLALLDQQASLNQELGTIQVGLSNLRSTTGFTDLDTHNYMDVFTQRLTNLELTSNELVLEVANTEAQMKALQRMATGPITEQVSRLVENDPVMIALLEQKILYEGELASVLAKYGENHMVVNQIKERIGEIDAKRKARSVEIGELIRQSNLLTGRDSLAVLQDRLMELNKQRQEAAQNKSNVDLARAQYENLIIKRDEVQSRLKEINSSIEVYNVKMKDPETSKVKKVGDAPVPLAMSFPRWQLFFPGGTILGLLIGIGLAFLLERLNDLVRTSRDIARYLPAQLLGVIPNLEDDELMEDIDPSLAVNKAPYSIISESYRRLRSNLKLFLTPTAKSILVTSGSAGDGKTTVAVNLGLSFGAQGKKVLLIDTNFWRPNLNTIFPKPELKQKAPVKKEAETGGEENDINGQFELGLSTVLAGLCGYHEVIRPSGIANCDIVDAGMLPPNPAELLGSPQMEQFIKHQSDKYDYVIIDGPPVLLVGDVKMLAKIVDGTILVFNATSTKRGEAIRTIYELNQVDANLFGCVLIAVKIIKGGYFKEQFRSYQDYQKLQFANTAT
jgi:capsular exopolysaccharide synthesis family protein